ncbi:hypothetical protein BDW59DRAFT_77858 [Aspergillus cavernicola]|uniref:RING finger domain protein n=1 Tax=Aspergillus cavernicola TaxID=176166 RepID=A0ABR4IZV3_9EURO
MARSTQTANAAPIIPLTPQLKRKRPVESHDDSLTNTVKNTRQKRTPARSGTKSKDVIDLTGECQVTNSARKIRSPKGKKAPTKPAPERRARKFRSSPPKTFQQRLQRATTQRMFVVGQTVAGTGDIPELKFDIVGTTGNIYKTFIGKEPTCSCPDALKGNQCKHICYVLVKVLSAPVHLQYQLAFLSSELRGIYENSPLRQVKDKAEEPETDGKRKPVDGDCPICFMEFEPEKEDIVWCRAACGNNIHKTCFQKWAATQQAQGVRCVYCRASWQNEDANGKFDVNLQQLLSQGEIGRDGYVNVASQMGLSGERGTRPSLLFNLLSTLGAPALVLFWMA